MNRDISLNTVTNNFGSNQSLLKQVQNRYTEFNEWEIRTGSNSYELTLIPETELIRQSYKLRDPNGNTNGIRYYETNQNWTIKLDYSGIDIGNRIAGVIAGKLSPTNKNYLLWGFFSNSEKQNFKGFGVSSLPQQVWTSSTAITGINCGKGSITRFNCGLVLPEYNPLMCFVGQRVIATDGVLLSSSTNHGTIVSVSNSYLDVQLDNDTRYGAALNTPPISGSGLIMPYTFKPINNTGSLYNNYDYKYLGMLCYSNSQLYHYRKPENECYFIDEFILYQNTTSVNVNTVINLVKWLPLDIEYAFLRIFKMEDNSVSKMGRITITPQGSPNIQFIGGLTHTEINSIGKTIYSSQTYNINALHEHVGPGNNTGAIYLTGFKPKIMY